MEFFEVKVGPGGQGHRGEVKLPNLDRARQLKERGYIVLPDPTDPLTIEQYNLRGIREFERHSRVAMVQEEEFFRQVEYLRRLGPSGFP